MNTQTKQRRVLNYAGHTWLLPLTVHWRFVDDAHGRTVLEADPETAKALCKMLNELAQKG